MPDADRLHGERATTFARWFRYAQGGTRPLRVFCVLACFGLIYHASKLAFIWRTGPRYDVMLVALNFCSLIVLQIIALAVSYCFYRADRRATGN